MSQLPSVSGWRRDLEDWTFLDASSDESSCLLMRGQYQESTLDPRAMLRVENQGQQGSCQGHSISTVVEWCYVIATRDPKLQLSRAMGYYETQRLDGIRGDSGSTIAGGVKLAETIGICEESLWPYPSRYNAQRPSNWSEVEQNANRYRIGTRLRITSYDGLRTFLGAGIGGVNIGVAWGNSLQRSVVENYSGGSGGHAISLISLSDRKDSAGRPYVWMLNSWGTSFGNQGWSEWSPRACEQIFQHRYTVAIGVSDMPHIKPREFSIEDWAREIQW